MAWPKHSFNETPYRYEFCLSFAGEQRQYVQAVAENLKAAELRVFYDEFEQVNLWGKNLYDHLSYVYSQAARFCVLFASRDYTEKAWTSLERRSAQERAMIEGSEYILPVVFDDTKIPGLLSTVSYIDAREATPEQVASKLIAKIKSVDRVGYVPPEPTALFQTLNVTSKDEKKAVLAVTQSFVRDFSRATQKERRLFFYCTLRACPHGRLSNPHVTVPTLQREFEASLDDVIATLEGMASLNVGYSFSRYCQGVPSDEALYVRWDSADHYVSSSISAYARNYSTRVVTGMIRAAITHVCDDCVEELIRTLDFSNLSSDIAKSLYRNVPEADYLPFGELDE